MLARVMSAVAVVISSCCSTGLPVSPISTEGKRARASSMRARISSTAARNGSVCPNSLSNRTSTRSSVPPGARRYSRSRGFESSRATSGWSPSRPAAISAIAGAAAAIAASSASLAAQLASRHCSSGVMHADTRYRASASARKSTAARASGSCPFGSTAMIAPSRSPNSARNARYARMYGRLSRMSESVSLSIRSWNAPSHAPSAASTAAIASTARGRAVTSAASRCITAPSLPASHRIPRCARVARAIRRSPSACAARP